MNLNTHDPTHVMNLNTHDPTHRMTHCATHQNPIDGEIWKLLSVAHPGRVNFTPRPSNPPNGQRLPPEDQSCAWYRTL